MQLHFGEKVVISMLAEVLQWTEDQRMSLFKTSAQSPVLLSQAI